jgi:peroxiredoxin
MRARNQVAAAFALATWLSAFGLAASGHADELQRVEIGARAPNFDLAGADGHRHRLSDYAGKTVVLEWTSPVCPYTAMKYKSGAMQALQRQAAGQGAVWISIDTAAPGRPGYLTPRAMTDRLAETHAVATAFLSDPDGKVGRAYGAKTTPSFYIIGRDGRLEYQGAMDDDPSVDDLHGRNYIRAALDDIHSGRIVKDAETRPYGCAVEY